MDTLVQRLSRLSQNLCWAWNLELDAIFRFIDVELWRQVNHNPIAFLQDVDPNVMSEKDGDAYLMARVVRVEKWLEGYLDAPNHWAAYNAPGLSAFPVAYFSPEFALHESLAVYSGGLGVLAGDHLKSCSDLGIPALGVTLLYRQGYFTQHIDAEGRQSEAYKELDMSRIAVTRVTGSEDEPLSIRVPLADKECAVDVWQANVGRCRLLLLDVADADPVSGYTPRLYGGDRTARIVQEIVLGVGGYRALRALGVEPGVMHLNEGHSAFALLEAVAERIERTGLGFEEASEEIRESVVFTTHTPVEAGHDRFAPDLVTHFLSGLARRMGISDRQLLSLGRVGTGDGGEEFCMTVLALKLSQHANAVSSLHGFVSRRMWRSLWPGRPSGEVPIGHITNGVHVDTWLANELAQLYSDTLGVDWRSRMTEAACWYPIGQLDDATLWSIKMALKRRLFEFIRRRQQGRSERVGERDEPLAFRPDVLTIGFARRFAAYKRALLLFENFGQAKRFLTDPERPVQLVFAGKAHPADELGKGLIQRLVEISQDPDLHNHVIVVENHDMNVSRHLLEGCDLWLNAPRRPMEACGTSGMKAVFNATLNCSTLDGWWDEAYDTKNGFAYGGGLVHANPAIQDKRDAESLFEVLTSEVIPKYYDRTASEPPSTWLAMVKHALQTLAWRYNSDRMVMDYTRRMYLSASRTLTAEFRGRVP